jgi:hypothetical protein
MNTLTSKHREDIKIFIKIAKERYQDKEIQDEIINKLPTIFLDYVYDLLSIAETHIEQENTITTAAGAWNLSFISEDKAEKEINRFIKKMNLKKDPDMLNAFNVIFRSLIIKKKTEYSFVRRFIDKVIFNNEKDGFSLQLISSPVP